ncbi:MAG: dienelactone hydrolase [Kiritimatiellia bacterium]|jgi:dienelactone hydrolase
MLTTREITCFVLALVLVCSAFSADSLPVLIEDQMPQSVRALYADYDARREPLEVRVVREWQEEGNTIRLLTYTIGTFKGQKATMAAFYAFPTQHEGKLPGLIHMHGGGQRASIASATYAANNGYAGLSINWGGRPMEKALADEPTTDWGAVDATQAGHNSHYSSLLPDKLTIDPFESPRNSNWYLIVLAAKRGVTFLEQQPEVDGDRLGAFGHSMGGKLTVMLAGADQRIKAGTPSCGGSGTAPDVIRDRPNAGVRPKKSDLYHRTIDDAQSLKEIHVPMLYVGPHNDFNGILDNMYENWKAIPCPDVAFTITPHMNHRAIAEHTYAEMLWFADHLKGTYDFPSTPVIAAVVKTSDGRPRVTLTPDRPGQVARVQLYASVDSHILTRFWRSVPAVREGDTWLAQVPVSSTDQPLFVMANVYYPLTHSVVGYPWMREPPETFGISSRMLTYTPDELKQGEVKARPAHLRMLQEDFADTSDGYQLNWKNEQWWSTYTRKIKDPLYAGPDGARLSLDVKVDHDLTFFFEVQDNAWGAFPGQPNGPFYAPVTVKASPEWQTVGVSVADFKPVEERTKHALTSWRQVTELGVRGRIKLTRNGEAIELPGPGSAPNARWRWPREMRNLRWEGGTYAEATTVDGQQVLSEAAYKEQFQKGIDTSIELEKRDR